MFSLLCFIGAMVVMQASASAVVTPFGAIHGLTRRQSDTPFDPNDIPVQCKAQCALISDTFSRCQAKPVIGCDCSVADEDAFVACLNCMVNLTPSQALTDQAQGGVDKYIAACASVGFPLPATKVAGASPTPIVTQAGGAPPTAAAGNTFTINTFQPTPTSASNTEPSDPEGSDTGSSNGLPGIGVKKNAAPRVEVGATGVVLSAAVYVIFF